MHLYFKKGEHGNVWSVPSYLYLMWKYFLLFHSLAYVILFFHMPGIVLLLFNMDSRLLSCVVSVSNMENISFSECII